MKRILNKPDITLKYCFKTLVASGAELYENEKYIKNIHFDSIHQFMADNFKFYLILARSVPDVNVLGPGTDRGARIDFYRIFSPQPQSFLIPAEALLSRQMKKYILN